MSFSARNRIAPSKEMQIESMDEPLRNGLWNAFIPIIKAHTGYGLLHDIWIDFFKQPLDRLPKSRKDRYDMFRDGFFGSEWNEVYDLIEFVCAHDMSNLKRDKLGESNSITNLLLSDYINASEFVKKCNSVLEREISAWRIIGGKITRITSELEMKAVDVAMHSQLSGVRQHITTATDLLYDRENPDYGNSMKESISAVELICAKITKQNAPILSKALDKMEKDGIINLHPALKKAFEKLYGYAGSGSGIRHANINDDEITLELAQFFLIACSAFTNHLTALATKKSINLE